MKILHEPSFFLTKTIGDPHGDVLGLINPFSSNSCTCSLISAFSKADNLYIPMLGNGASCYKLISCTISFWGCYTVISHCLPVSHPTVSGVHNNQVHTL